MCKHRIITSVNQDTSNIKIQCSSDYEKFGKWTLEY